jgi:hypothetical protein
VHWLDRPDLPPGAFAFVMGTGILALAAAAHGYHAIFLGLATAVRPPHRTPKRSADRTGSSRCARTTGPAGGTDVGQHV